MNLRYSLFTLLCGFLATPLATAAPCEISNAALVKYEDQILKAAGEFSKRRDSSHLFKVTA